MNARAPTPSLTASVDGDVLYRMVRTDQLVVVRRSVMSAISINVVLSFTATLVALNAGRAFEGLIWLLLSLAVNGARSYICRWPFAPSPGVIVEEGVAVSPTGRPVEWHLRVAATMAAASGCVWALIPLLCNGYSSPQAIFYLTVVCGICAGSVTYGIAYAFVPISFITPALLSVVGCLLYAGGFDNVALAAMVLLYLGALARGALQSDKAFREGSRLKNEATALASQLRQVHALSLDATQQLAFRASHDSLTGLLNREGFTEAATLHIAVPDGRQHGLLLLDLDGFKAVNDAFGHKIGDRVLQDVAGWLQRELAGMNATLGRWGGDEFAVLYTLRADRQAPTAIAQALIRSISFATAHYGGHLGVSIGISVAGDADVADMISFADEALYEAKRTGRNRFQMFDKALNQRLATRRDVERDLLHAIEARAIGVWYQPIMACDSNEVHSLEALMRWHHPRHGHISPEEVIFAAANTGLAEPLLRHLVDEVCRGMRQFEAAGSSLAAVPVAINVSPREMAQLAVDDIVLGMLKSRGIAPRRLQIEITEEVALDTHATRSRLSALSAAGVAIVVDDFGVGYSSLASLRSEYVRQVKIDRSFILGLSSSPGNVVLVDSIVQLGRSLNLQVVAEGVETQEELDALRALGCKLVQGYHLARPAPLPDVMSWAVSLAAAGVAAGVASGAVAATAAAAPANAA
ncbi:diguanylate cyclase (GGDEF) domain-containing protein [Variovorax sp. OK605]|uniref:putative bifunctional diguanylate cyclase/phosphodiesterase n=1 Tax=Variovorax sp. OK605 TaxID=1855317 RepID=UPI0008ECC7AB|nr:bifunctional diguanylate cyclase/phosphodiesterase [Variovorax sp. OK605]SFP58313.1 diguanylate cyclase (GGDEF) domain-containing protein [Variovorax sp. OK605]